MKAPFVSLKTKTTIGTRIGDIFFFLLFNFLIVSTNFWMRLKNCYNKLYNYLYWCMYVYFVILIIRENDWRFKIHIVTNSIDKYTLILINYNNTVTVILHFKSYSYRVLGTWIWNLPRPYNNYVCHSLYHAICWISL